MENTFVRVFFFVFSKSNHSFKDKLPRCVLQFLQQGYTLAKSSTPPFEIGIKCSMVKRAPCKPENFSSQ